MGVSLKEINPQSYGVNFYGDSLFVSGDLLDENPELVEKFIKATLKGWEYAINNPEEIINLMEKNLTLIQDIDDGISFNKYQSEVVNELMGYPFVTIGHINPYRWDKMQQYLYEIGLIETKLEANDYIFDPVMAEIERVNKMKKYLTISGAALLFILLILVLWVYSLRRSVKIRTMELKKSEHEYRALFDNAGLGIGYYNPEGKVIWYNKVAAKNMGGKPDDFVGKSFYELFPKKDADIYFKRLKKTITSNEKNEYEDIVSLPGGDMHFNSVYNKIYDINNKLLGVEIISSDITERRKYEAQLRNQQKIEAIGTLASGVAHEINNPINGIMNYGQIILDCESSDENIRESAKEIIHETQRVSKIVRNLLAFSRQKSDQYSRTSVEDIVENTLSLIKTVIKNDQIELTTNTEENLPEIICRNQQIQQVLMNLMTNARDALNERYKGYNENKRIEISAVRLKKNDMEGIQILVKDYGTGIPKDIQDRILDPFFTTKPRDKGTGLGLSISYRIVKEHGGELRFETVQGEYTKFIIELPCNTNEYN